MTFESTFGELVSDVPGHDLLRASLRFEARVLDAEQRERQLREASVVGDMPALSKRTPR